ncbi:MAG: recombinase family protein [Lachnospiraceae bacterium]|nr:recombinase family protein [Lachnospiraceae bacterium]
MARTSKKKQEIKRKPVKIYYVGIYARLSVDSGDRKNESIETQVEIVKAFIAQHDDMVVYGVYTDLGKTGTSFEREGFERMMRDVRARKIDCIIVKDLSRFGRNHIETGNYIEKIFPFMGVRFIAVTDNFDSMDISGQNETMSVNLKNLVNEMYARDIAVKVKASKRAKWEQGSYTGGIPPYGYRAEWIDGKKYLFIEETTSDIVRKIYGLFLSGSNMNEIVAWLYENKVARPTEYHKTGQVFCADGQELFQWSRATVRMILSNPVYVGNLVQGCTCGKDYKTRRRHDVDASDWSVKEHTHEAIVSEELFLEAAQKFEKSAVYCNRDGFSKAVPTEEDLFTDVIYCGECGSKMRRVAVIKKFSSRDMVRTYSYKCPKSGRIDSLNCPGRSITMGALTDIVKETIRQEFTLSGMRPKDLVEMNEREMETLKEKWNGQLAMIERKLEGITKAGSEQYLKYRSGEIDEKGFRMAKEENDKKADSLRAESRDITEKLREIDSETARKNHFLRTLMKGSKKGELTAEIVRTLFERIEVYPGHRVKTVFAFKRSEFLSGGVAE